LGVDFLASLAITRRQVLEFGTVSSGSTEVLPLTVTDIGRPGTVTVGTAIPVRGTTGARNHLHDPDHLAEYLPGGHRSRPELHPPGRVFTDLDWPA